jgi:hypothetical protein
MADPLIGKFFSSYEVSKEGVREIVWNGQIRSRVKEGLYLVKLVNALNLVAAGIVSFEKQIMVPLDDMKNWSSSIRARRGERATRNTTARRMRAF